MTIGESNGGSERKSIDRRGQLAAGLAWGGAYLLAGLTWFLGYLLFWDLVMPHASRRLGFGKAAMLSAVALAAGGLAIAALLLGRHAGRRGIAGWLLAVPVWATAAAGLVFAVRNF